MTDFNSFGLPESILHTLTHMGYETPTPIQEQTIPVALDGKDILGSAQTGTGKTAAFAIPLACHILADKNATALILLPTRELADQVAEVVRNILGKNSKNKTALLIGGASIFLQIKQLKMRPRIIVGTPGRINDHLKRKTLNLSNTDFFVLDEMDRMLDMGFGEQLEEINQFLPAERQTLMFSATLPAKIISVSKKYLKEPVRIAIGSTTAVAKNVKQENIAVTDTNKYESLIEQLNVHNGSSLIFVKTKFGTEKLVKKLVNEGLTATALHGDLKQSKRTHIINDFKHSKMRILVATDIAARGLDINHIESVINYDLPQCPEDYIHRIGRTARAGAEGVAINLLCNKDKSKWRAISQLLAGDADTQYERPKKPKKHPKLSVLKKRQQREEESFDSQDFSEKKSPRTERSYDAPREDGFKKKRTFKRDDDNFAFARSDKRKSPRTERSYDAPTKETHKKKRAAPKPFIFKRFQKNKTRQG